MTIKELMDDLGSDSGAVLARFGNNEALLMRFIKKFLEDPNFSSLGDAIESKDYSHVEMASHTLKGVAANLGFDVLSTKSAAIVNAVRGGEYERLEHLFEELKEAYDKTIKGISELS